MTDDIQINNLILEMTELIRNLGATAKIQATINSVVDGQSLDETTEQLRYINETYCRDEALYQVKVLMAKHNIRMDELSYNPEYHRNMVLQPFESGRWSLV